MPDLLLIDDEAVLWSAPPAERAGRPVIVLLHGYGSDERDLFGLVAHLPSEFVYVSVRAPLTPAWPMPGYSWYPIEGLGGRSAESVSAGAQVLLEWIGRQDFAADQPLGLLGFSQGGAISIQALRLKPESIDFVVNLSGYAPMGDLETDAALAAVKPPVFWGRGTHDEVIPAALIDHSVEWLPGFVELSGRVYAGLGHAVSGEELVDIAVFLRKRLEAAEADPATSPGD